MRLSHWGISESMLVTSSSKHFVGCHALRRLWVPRYPPSSLDRLTLTTKLYPTDGSKVKSFYSYFFKYLVVPVEVSGFEPLTSALQGQRSTN